MNRERERLSPWLLIILLACFMLCVFSTFKVRKISKEKTPTY